LICRRCSLKIRPRKACWFDSDFGHPYSRIKQDRCGPERHSRVRSHAKSILNAFHGDFVANVAILVGNTQYQSPSLSTLDCCGDDVRAMEELLDATKKFTTIDVLLNAESPKLKDHIRATLSIINPLMKYFSTFLVMGLPITMSFSSAPVTLTTNAQMKRAYQLMSFMAC